MDLKEANYLSYSQKKNFHIKFTKKFKNYAANQHKPKDASNNFKFIINERQKLLFLIKSFRRLKKNHCTTSGVHGVARHHYNRGNSYKWVCTRNSMISLNNMISKRKEMIGNIKHLIKYNFM